MATLDKESIRNAYDDVRNDNSETTWASFKYEGKQIINEDSGSDFEDFKTKFTAEDRGFGYLRVTTGDELSKRAKFVFISWCGNEVGGLKRAKLGTDKASLKQILQNFAIELQLSELHELNLDTISAEARRARGANYGTGAR